MENPYLPEGHSLIRSPVIPQHEVNTHDLNGAQAFPISVPKEAIMETRTD